ncbi:MAG: 4Fe-4S dicluster domain-containing protein [Ignisphaera sp.]|uniref:Ferredoxin n=1 Tax=Ignisphaera aggregans TaxID=334771 RepID=A0A7C4NJP7_9CREN
MSKELNPVSVLGIGVRRFILFDKCIGCYTCEEVCKFLNNDQAFIKLYEVESGLNKPISCFHCAKAPCVLVCPTNALLFDRDGAVITRTTRCIGCTSCMVACPFGIPELLPVGYVIKCDLCSKLRGEGLEPGCVAVCPTNAITWGSPEDIVRLSRERTISRFMDAFKVGEKS